MFLVSLQRTCRMDINKLFKGDGFVVLRLIHFGFQVLKVLQLCDQAIKLVLDVAHKLASLCFAPRRHPCSFLFLYAEKKTEEWHEKFKVPIHTTGTSPARVSGSTTSPFLVAQSK